MLRRLLVLLAALCLACWAAELLLAQEGFGPRELTPDPYSGWPANAEPGWFGENPHDLIRGSGGYFSIFKLVCLWGLFALWVWTVDWVNRDTQNIGLPHYVWNPVVFFPFPCGLLLFGLTVPIFWIGWPLAFIVYLVPTLIYVKRRNRFVSIDERVLTREHIRFLIATRTQWGVSKEKKMEHEQGPPVVFKATAAADDAQNQVNLVKARQTSGYVTAKEVFATAVSKRAERILLDYTREGVNQKLLIDGVWHDMPPLTREVGDPLLAALKTIANLNPDDRRGKQEGRMGVEFHGKKWGLVLTSQGVPTGERATLQLTGHERKFKTLAELGMREKQQEQLKQLLASPRGIFIFSALPAGGLTTTVSVSLLQTDRLMRDWKGVQDKAAPEPEIENVDITTYAAAAGQTPDQLLPTIFRKEPDCMLVRDLVNVESLNILLEQAIQHDKFIVTTTRAKEAIEALLRVLALRPEPAQFAQAAVGVLNVRLIRKLCDKCKEAYEPTPQLLAQLGIPEGRINQLYRERQPLPPDSKEKREPCRKCSELGYFDRTALFELLTVDDKLREALIKQPQLETLRKVARASGHRTLRDEGIALLARGETSVSELSRVLKQ